MVATVNISNGYLVEGTNIGTDGKSFLNFTISLSEPLTSPQSIKYATFNGTATGGSSNTSDYLSTTTGSITFAAGEIVKTISIQVFNDNITELDESFYLNVFIPKDSFLYTLLKFEDPTIPGTDILSGTATGIISDTIYKDASYTLEPTVENLTLTGTGNFSGTGNDLNNIITGNSGANNLVGGVGNDTLEGKGGDDTLTGGSGNDVYIISNQAGIVEAENSIINGNDTVLSSVSYTLPANVENLTLTGSGLIDGTGNALNNNLVGNGRNNILTGDEGSDTLDGGAGNDTLRGGLGDDYYVIAQLGDKIEGETSVGGIDTVVSSLNYRLGANLENLVLTRNALQGTGNTLNNKIVGNNLGNTLNGGNGSDTLDGGAGDDTLIGGNADDFYLVDSANDVITETATGGNLDVVQASVNYTLGANLEKLILAPGTDNLEGFGNTLKNILVGNDGNNFLDGGTGGDTMEGGKGNDTYLINEVSDIVTEKTGEGIDTVETEINNYTLPLNVDNLNLAEKDTILVGTGNTLPNVLIGNSYNNTLNGNTGNDTLDGGVGNDTLNGGTGNDIYYVDSVGDVITGEGTDVSPDLVISSVTYTLPLNVEHLNLVGSLNLSGTGNDSNNNIIGNTGNNTLNGGIGNDSLTGGAGNDSLIGGTGDDTLDGGLGVDSLTGGTGNDLYRIDRIKDTIVEETLDGGIDTVEASFSYILKDHLENLTLTGTGNFSGTGNSVANIIKGNTGANALNGLDGNDSIDGGTGNDIILGGTGDDTLIGGTGNDTLIGNTGNDSYTVDTSFDVIIEQASEGTDIVTFIGTTGTYILSDNLENLTLFGTTTTAFAINGTGNSLNNTITGNIASNIIDGGTGADILTGDKGNDIYLVDNAGDKVSETSTITTEIDTVFSSVTYTLTNNVENLNLTGTANLNGTGNDLRNNIIGNEGNNTLNGGGGNDILDGGLGVDSLIGGLGNDTYIVDNSGDKVTETLNQGTDTVVSFINYTLTTDVENLTLGGVDNINGTGNNQNNSIYGNSGDNILYGGGGNDLLYGGAGADKFNYNTTKLYASSAIGLDEINDFKPGEDKIVLGKITFGFPLAQTSLLDSDFAVVDLDEAAEVSPARIIYSRETGNLFYNPNGATEGDNIFLQLPTTNSLSASDFLLE